MNAVDTGELIDSERLMALICGNREGLHNITTESLFHLHRRNPPFFPRSFG
jgi:hypothetical protein